MGYEVINIYGVVCPCGNGTYLVEVSLNDWGKHQEAWSMDCPVCREKFILKSKIRYDSGIAYKTFKWVSKISAIRAEEALKEREKLRLYLEEKYLPEFLKKYENMPLKYIWGKLTGNGKEYPSLQTFYKHVRESGREQHLKFYFRNNFKKCLALAGAPNEEIERYPTVVGNVQAV